MNKATEMKMSAGQSIRIFSNRKGDYIITAHPLEIADTHMPAVLFKNAELEYLTVKGYESVEVQYLRSNWSPNEENDFKETDWHSILFGLMEKAGFISCVSYQEVHEYFLSLKNKVKEGEF